MLELSDVARREEARCARGVSEVAIEHIALAGGIASRGEPGTWVNSAFGMGMVALDCDGPPGADGATMGAPGSCDATPWRHDVDRLIAWHSEAGVEPRIELSPYAQRGLVRAVADAGFVPRGFEQVFFRELRPDEPIGPSAEPGGPLVDAVAANEHRSPSGPEAVVVDRNDDVAVGEFAAVVARGFAPHGTEPRAADVALFERCVRHARTTAVAARLDGRTVGGGAMEQLDDVVALYGLSVLPEFRRRGVQQALIAARLRMGVLRGARLATIGGWPGMGTERNVRRFGFQVAYTRIMLVRPGPGLAPVT